MFINNDFEASTSIKNVDWRMIGMQQIQPQSPHMPQMMNNFQGRPAEQNPKAQHHAVTEPALNYQRKPSDR